MDTAYVRENPTPEIALLRFSTPILGLLKNFWWNLESSYGGFLKWWYPTTMGFPTKNDHFGVFWGYHHLRKHPYELVLSCDGRSIILSWILRWLLLGSRSLVVAKRSWWGSPVGSSCWSWGWGTGWVVTGSLLDFWRNLGFSSWFGLVGKGARVVWDSNQG